MRIALLPDGQARIEVRQQGAPPWQLTLPLADRQDDAALWQYRGLPPFSGTRLQVAADFSWAELIGGPLWLDASRNTSGRCKAPERRPMRRTPA